MTPILLPFCRDLRRFVAIYAALSRFKPFCRDLRCFVSTTRLLQNTRLADNIPLDNIPPDNSPAMGVVRGEVVKPGTCPGGCCPGGSCPLNYPRIGPHPRILSGGMLSGLELVRGAGVPPGFGPKGCIFRGMLSRGILSASLLKFIFLTFHGTFLAVFHAVHQALFCKGPRFHTFQDTFF